VGAQLHLPNLEEGSVIDRLDRLASLLQRHTPDRLAEFWRELPTMGRKRVGPAPVVGLEQAIKDRMMSLHLTAYAAGKMSGVSPTVIQRFLNGERGLTLATADKLCQALDLTLSVKPYSTLDLDLVREREESREKRERND
jgi:plasmid maintenance system antidote protein VapI